MVKKKTTNKSAKKVTSKKSSAKVTKKPVKKVTKKKLVHSSNVAISVASKEFEKEIKSVRAKPSFFGFEMHPYAMAALIILVILFFTAAMLSYFSLSSTVDAIIENAKGSDDLNSGDGSLVKTTTEESNDLVLNNASLQEPISNSCNSQVVSIMCSSEYPNYPCTYAYDNNNETQWLSQVVCRSRQSPCAVRSELIVTSPIKFDVLELNNRIEDQFYINRVLLTYNNITNEEYILSFDYTSTPWVVNLTESTTSVKVTIAEIVGVGSNIQTGLSEVNVYDSNCMS